MERSTSRDRSRSPVTTSKPKSSKSSKSSGFKWKEKKAKDGAEEDVRTQSRYRERTPERERKRPRKHDGNEATKEAAPKPPAPALDPNDDIAAKFGVSSASLAQTAPANTTSTNGSTDPTTSTTPKPKKSKPTAPQSTGPMIVVKINDRLGTTSKVPCLASDTVGDFKKLIAMRIGRKPHEIMLKRQSERPFKDFLTLADYGVSDGVQLDLELDTGD